MKKRFLSLFLTMICLALASYSNPFITLADSAKKNFDITLASNELTRGLHDVSTFTVYDSTLYFINNNKLVEINLTNGNISTNNVVNNFLKKLPKDKNFVSRVKVTGEGYYLTIFNDLYRISTTGSVSHLYHSFRFFWNIYVNNDKLLVATRDSIELINKEGHRLNVKSFPASDNAGYINSSEGMYYQATLEDSIYEFKSNGNNTISVSRFAPLEAAKIKEPYISWVTDKYFLVIPYAKRDVIYAVKKGAKNEVYKTIDLKRFNLTPSQPDIQNEEGYPKFKIEYSNNVFYALSLIKGKLRVLSFNL